MPANGSVGTITLSPRYVSQVRDAARARAVRRPPLPRAVRAVPVARHPARVEEREHRDLPRLRRLVAGLRVRQPGDARATRTGCTAGSRSRAAARHFIDRYFPGDYKVIPNGVDVDRFRRAVPVARWQDGTREHPVRRPVRAAQGRPRPAQGVPDPAQDRLRLPAAARRRRAAGARGAPLRRDPPAARRRVPGPRLATTRRPSCSAPPTSTSRRRPAASRSGSCCSRRWPPARRSSPPTSTATRASCGADREALLVPPREPKAIAGAIAPAARRAASSRAAMSRGRHRAGRGVQLAARDRQGRGLLRVRRSAGWRRRAAAGRTSPPRCRRRRAGAGAAGGSSADGPIGAAPAPRTGAGRRAIRACRGSGGARRALRPAGVARRRGRRLGERHPPHPARVGDHGAGDDEEHHQDREARVGERDRPAPVDRVHRELERVQVGRQQALVGVDERRTAAAAPRCSGTGPRTRRAAAITKPADEPPRVARRDDLERDERQRDRDDQRDELGRRSRARRTAVRVGRQRAA